MHLDKCIFWWTPAPALPSQRGGKKSWTVSSWLNCTFIPDRGQWQLEEAILKLEISSIFTMQDFLNFFFFFWCEPNNHRTSQPWHFTDTSDRKLQPSSPAAEDPPGLMKTDSFVNNQSQSSESSRTHVKILTSWSKRGGIASLGALISRADRQQQTRKGRSIWGARGCATLCNKDTADWFLCRHRQRSKRRSKSMEISNPVRISAFIGDQ